MLLRLHFAIKLLITKMFLISIYKSLQNSLQNIFDQYLQKRTKFI